jgi:hypothetical protein
VLLFELAHVTTVVFGRVGHNDTSLSAISAKNTELERHGLARVNLRTQQRKTITRSSITIRETFPAWISRNTTPDTVTRSHEAITLLPADKMPFRRGNYRSFKAENGKVCVFSHGSRGRCVTRPAGALPRPLPSAPPSPPLPLFSFLFLTGSSGGFAAENLQSIHFSFSLFFFCGGVYIQQRRKRTSEHHRRGKGG